MGNNLHNINKFREQLYKDYYFYIRDIAEHQLKDQKFLNEVIELTFYIAFHRTEYLMKHNDVRGWICKKALETIEMCNNPPKRGKS